MGAAPVDRGGASAGPCAGEDGAEVWMMFIRQIGHCSQTVSKVLREPIVRPRTSRF